MVVTKMERPGGAHAGENTFCVHIYLVETKNEFDSPRGEITSGS
jgi:hypothetical protein